MAIQWKQHETQLERLHDRESERGREVSNMAIDIEGIVYLVRETWRALSARDQKNKRLKATAQHERSFDDAMGSIETGGAGQSRALDDGGVR